MLLVHEPVKLRKNKNKNTYIPLLTLEECTLGSAYGFIMAAILKLLSQDSIELAGLGAAASPSNGCGPSNDVLEECYFLLCWFGALRKKVIHKFIPLFAERNTRLQAPWEYSGNVTLKFSSFMQKKVSKTSVRKTLGMIYSHLVKHSRWTKGLFDKA